MDVVFVRGNHPPTKFPLQCSDDLDLSGGWHGSLSRLLALGRPGQRSNLFDTPVRMALHHPHRRPVLLLRKNHRQAENEEVPGSSGSGQEQGCSGNHQQQCEEFPGSSGSGQEPGRRGGWSRNKRTQCEKVSDSPGHGCSRNIRQECACASRTNESIAGERHQIDDHHFRDVCGDVISALHRLHHVGV